MKKLLPVFLLSMIGILAACSASTQNNSKQSQESATLPVTLTPVTHNQRGTQIVIQPRQSTIKSKQVKTETPESKNTPARISTATSPSSLTSTPLTAPTLGPDDWESLPVIPQISPNAVKIYQDGVSLGNDPDAFSKIGDCGSTPAWFLGDFDRDPKYYRLGENQELAVVIEEFHGSFGRTSLAAKSGFNASSIFSSLWADPEQCERNESPIDCEYRVHRPTIAFIMLGSNDVFHPDDFEPQMRKIIETSISKGVLPILSTKADNVEGDGRINATIARLASDYDIPLWNYWRAVQDLPDQGLQEDKVHITWAPNRFDDPLAMSRGWPIRNLNALQILDAIWKAVNTQ
jgi:hypothetical protein